MGPDDDVCLCFHVSLRKIRNYIEREKPAVPSQISECLGAGTGCHWCVPYLKRLHAQWEAGQEPNLDDVDPRTYGTQRAEYRQRGQP